MIPKSRMGCDPDSSRFAAGVVQSDNSPIATYELFRSYLIGEDSALRQGPKPEDCRTSEVFAATGAAKFFSKPYKVAKTTFFDETFPQSHPISSIALDEAIGLYGRGANISLLLNIGPGIPADKDCQELDLMSLGPISRLARSFSWTSGRRLSLKQRLLSTDGNKETAVNGSKLTSPSETAVRLEGRQREDIRARLLQMYGTSGAEKYHHLGPPYSAERASLNDVLAIRFSSPGVSDRKKQCTAEAETVVRQIWVTAAA